MSALARITGTALVALAAALAFAALTHRPAHTAAGPVPAAAASAGSATDSGDGSGDGSTGTSTDSLIWD